MKVLAKYLNWNIVQGYGSGRGYHPHISKPTSLEPISTDNFGNYYGPPPDAGFSYGLYSDGSNQIISKRAEELFSPFNGKRLQFVEPTAFENVNKACSNSKFLDVLHSCHSCSNAFVSSSSQDSALHCISCGDYMEHATSVMQGMR